MFVSPAASTVAAKLVVADEPSARVTVVFVLLKPVPLVSSNTLLLISRFTTIFS